MTLTKPLIRCGLACAVAITASLTVAKDRDRSERRSESPQTRSAQRGNDRGNSETSGPRINSGDGRSDNSGNRGGGQPAPRRIETPRAQSGGGNSGALPDRQPRVRGQSENSGPRSSPGGNNPDFRRPESNSQPRSNNANPLGNNPVLKRRDNDNRPGNNPPVVKPRDRNDQPKAGNPPNNPLGANKPVLKRRDNDVKPNQPARPNLPKQGDFTPRDKRDKPDAPNLGDRPVLKPRDRGDRPDFGGGKNLPIDPRGANKPVLKPRDRDGKPDGGSNLPNVGERNLAKRDRELNDAVRRFQPDTARRERNEQNLLGNKEEVEKFLSNNPQLRDKVRRQDGKIDLSRLHVEQDRKDRIAARIDKNGIPLNLENNRELADRFRKFDRVKDVGDLDRYFNGLRDPDLIRQNPELRRFNVDNASGRFQLQLARNDNREFDRLVGSRVGQQLHLHDQYALYSQGDVARQLNLNVALINGGGWGNRYVGPVYGGFTSHSFSSWYCGPGFYPPYAWTPIWSPWVDWSWWHFCPPIYDPRPIVVRPIYYYDPCPPWVVYDYPVWQPLPVVASGTWIDYSPVLVEQPDLQLVAVRFVDNGHTDQNLGPRFRVWLQNNSNTGIGGDFNVLLLASNTPTANADLPQAGVTVPSMEAGEMKSVDIRLPLAANKMNRVDNHLTPFEYLHVLVDSHRQLQDPTPENNGAVIARTEILPVDPAAFAPDVSAAAPGAIVSIAGEGFGPEPGRLIVSINGEETEATIYGWYDLGVQFEMPYANVTGPTDTEVLVVRGDGAASNPVTVRIAPEEKLGEAVLPPAPMP